MKQYLQLLIVVVLTCLLSSSTYYTAEFPNAAMHSTSAMTSCGSSLPCAASAGFVSADDNLSEGSNDLPSGPRRIGGSNMNNQEEDDNAFTSYFSASHFNTTLIADYTLIANSFISSALTFPIFSWSKNFLAEKTISFRLLSSVIDSFRLSYFTMRPFSDLFW